MALERTFSIIKPDATRRNITGKVIAKNSRGYFGIGNTNLRICRFIIFLRPCSKETKAKCALMFVLGQ